jgi:flagella basal body P-ring formation protein FlgA
MLTARPIVLSTVTLLLILMRVGPVAAEGESEKGTINIVVPRATIYPGDRIVDGLIDVRPVKANSSYASAVFTARAEVDGQIARRTLLPGRAIPRDAVRSAPIVQQGEPVSVVFLSGSIQIQLSGTALQSGAVGEIISVRNSDTGRIVRGRIKSDKSLEVTSQ